MGRPSPAFRMPRLASPFDGLRPHYDAVVVGSGYGGGIAAARLARAGLSVAVLERGRERHPGEYPSRLRDAARSVQLHVWGRRFGSETALFDIRGGDGLSALVGCGLGGTSLINANVCLEADASVWEDPRWPKQLTHDQARLRAGVGRAREMLGAQPLPPQTAELQKLWQLGREALALGAKLERPALAITFRSGTNQAGVRQGACRLCGDCVSGCNYGAKNTVLMNYLPYARKHGAAIFTELRVDAIERSEDRWLVRFWRVGTGQHRFRAPLRFVSADLVVLAAGTLGSTEILRRSKERGLELSDRVGERFSGNGDVLAFAYNCPAPVNGIGLGDERVADHDEVGPCIAGAIRVSGEQAEHAMVIEDGSPPGAIGKLVAVLLFAVSQLGFLRRPPRDSRGRRDVGLWRKLLSLPWNAYRGAAHHTQTHLVMTHDASRGTLTLERGRLRLRYPGVGDEDIFRRVDETLATASRAIGGTHIPNPLWHPPTGNILRILWHRFRHRDRFRLRRRTLKPGSSQLVTVHPLGGCPMAEHAGDGVVNDKHQVFCQRAGPRVYDSLYVMDGSVIPRSLGVNPLLTISGLAERACDHLLEARGHRLETDLFETDFPMPERRAEMLGLRFTEQMLGRVRILGEGDAELDYADAASAESAVDLDVILDMEIDDVDALIADPTHELRASGVARSEIFGPPAMVVRGSHAQILREDPERVNRRAMIYRLNVVTEDGRRYRIEGEKRVHDHIFRPKRLWDETTILYTRVYEIDEADADWKPQRQVARGVIRVTALGFLKQMFTYRTVHARSLFDRIGAWFRFMCFFSAQMCHHFFPAFAPSNRVKREAVRGRRPLVAPPPEVHSFAAQDGMALRLTRYRPDGARVPVILSHGLGVSSRIFSIDTIRPNLVEYLCERGYDVWLLDYRASIDLPHACNRQFNGDDVAKNDYPAALEFVRTRTDAERVHFFVHCFGASTFFMSVLGGHLPSEYVRSALVSQVATHMIPSLDTCLKSGAHVGEWLYWFGRRFLDAYTDDGASRANRLLDLALRFLPIPGEEERCRSEVCHRISFLYSMLYEHDRLNRETHDALAEMFGAANLTALRHLGEMSRRGKLVDFEGEDAYIPHMKARLGFPITFLSGSENYCYKPVSTRITYELLRELGAKFPSELPGPYEIRAIPGYGHIDCIFGRDAHRDVYPHLVEHLNRT